MEIADKFLVEDWDANKIARKRALHNPTVVSIETLNAACERIAQLEDFARNVAGMDRRLVEHCADLNVYRSTIREWQHQALTLIS